MNAARTLKLLASLLAVATLLVSHNSRAVEKLAELSSECVSSEAKRALSECPKGPKHFDIKKKRAVAFKSAPPPREVKKREDLRSRATPPCFSSMRNATRAKLG